MAKVIYSTDNIQSFGGLNFISEHFDKMGLDSIIEESLGSRGPLTTFSYADVIKNMWMLNFCGGDCAEDIQTHLRGALDNTQNMNVCSADTILRVQKELSTNKEIKLSKAGVKNEFNTNEKINILNMNMLMQTKALSTVKEYDLDFDNQFIPCEKFDSKKSYKKAKGYFPAIAAIGKYTIYFENRNGNSNVKFEQDKTLINVFNLLENNDIRIDRVRMDCGSFTKDVISTVETKAKRFYIRAMKCDDLNSKIKEQQTWETSIINDRKVEVCTIKYKPFGEDKQYRYVVSKERNPTGQLDVFTEDRCTYRAIITNDLKTSDTEIIQFYNQRGASEKIFDELNNDFGWAKIPFSFLEENTVFLMLMSMCRNFYLSMLQEMSQKLSFVKTTYRLKKFIYRFVVVPYKWVLKGGQKTLKLFTDKPYHLLV